MHSAECAETSKRYSNLPLFGSDHNFRMSGFKFYRGLVFEPDSEARARFRAVATASPRFDKVEPATTVQQALEYLNSERVDVIFIGIIPEITDFLKLAKATLYGKTAAIVFLKRTRPDSQEEVAAEMVAGADTVLFEPYSVENITETTKIADAIREADEKKKKEAALAMIFKSVVEEVDNIGQTSETREDSETLAMFSRLKHLGEQLKQATKSAAVDFFSSLSKTLEDAEPPTVKARKQAYGGVSERVQRILDKKKRDESS